MSARGLCDPCASANLGDAVASMMTRSGPKWDQWVARQRAFLERLEA